MNLLCFEANEKCAETFVKVRMRTLCRRQLSLLKTSSAFSPVSQGTLTTGPQ